MLSESITTLIATQRSRPRSLLVAALSLFAPTYLTLFLERPDVFGLLGVVGAVLLSVSLSAPIVLICVTMFYSLLSTLAKAERLVKNIPEPDGLLTETLQLDDPLEWHSLFFGSGLANVVLSVIAVFAYLKPISIGKTYLLVAVISIIVLVILATLAQIVYNKVERDVERVSANCARENPTV